MFFLWTNCLISHRIDTKLYIYYRKEGNRLCLSAIEFVVMSVELAVGFTRSFPSFLFLSHPRLIPVKNTVWRSCFPLCIFFFFHVNFVLCVSVVHFRNQRCCNRPPFSSLSQTSCSQSPAVVCCAQLDMNFSGRFRKRKITESCPHAHNTTLSDHSLRFCDNFFPSYKTSRNDVAVTTCGD